MRTERGLDRRVTFLDAVVAIAVTLLVLPLIDLLGSGSERHDLGALLTENRAQFGSFLLTFVVISRAPGCPTTVFSSRSAPMTKRSC